MSTFNPFTINSTHEDNPMNRHSDDNNLLTAYKPRPWGEELNGDSHGYTRPDPTSKTHIPSCDSIAKSGTGSNIVPWN